MKYLLMIFGDESVEAQMSEAEQQEMYGEYHAFTEKIEQQGIHRGGEALQPTSTATTVSVRDGRTITTDGPYVETKEQLGGFYVVETETLDQAIAAAAMIPGARNGHVEVRPLIEFDG